MAGYPVQTLPKKLGIKAGQTVSLLNAPSTFQRALYASIDVSSEARFMHDLRMPMVDMIVRGVDSTEDLEDRFSSVTHRMHPAGDLWIAYRTNSRRISEELVRRIALTAGMVANKACEIDGTYTAVRLVMRSEIRDAILYRTEPPPALSRLRRSRRPTARIAPRVARASSGGGSTLRRVRARSSR